MSGYEIIDVVNDQDEVIGTIERTPEWNKTRHTLFRTVGVFVWRSDGTLVVQRRALHKSGPLSLDNSVGGVVPSGMDPHAAALKEMSEELGLTGDLEFVCKARDLKPDGRLRAFLHLFTITHDEPYSNWEREAERLEFMTSDEMDYMTKRFPYMFTGGLLEAWKAYKAVKGMA